MPENQIDPFEGWTEDEIATYVAEENAQAFAEIRELQLYDAEEEAHAINDAMDKKRVKRTLKRRVRSLPPEPKEINTLDTKNARKTALRSLPPKQLNLDVSCAATIDGVEMGVLSDGTAYLSRNGLAAVCGIDPMLITRLAQDWESTVTSGIFTAGRMQFIHTALTESGYTAPSLFVPIILNGVTANAFPAAVCTVLLEFYAFESAQAKNATALRSYRELARYGIDSYIKEKLNWTPPPPQTVAERALSAQRYRASINAMQTPMNSFTIIDVVDRYLLLPLEMRGITLPADMIIDISIGKTFCTWLRDECKRDTGTLPKYPHLYPDGRTVPANAYPLELMPYFITFFLEVWLVTKVSPYFQRKGQTLALEAIDTQIRPEMLQMVNQYGGLSVQLPPKGKQ